MSHTALLDSVSAFLSAFPAEMLAGAAPAVAIGEHLCSSLFREAPLRTRACALALEASEGGAVVSALAQLHAGIQQRILYREAEHRVIFDHQHKGGQLLTRGRNGLLLHRVS